MTALLTKETRPTGIVPGTEHTVSHGRNICSKRLDYVDRNGFFHRNVTPTTAALTDALSADWQDIDEFELPADVNAPTESARFQKLRAAALRLERAGILDIRCDIADRPIRAFREGSFYVRARSFEEAPPKGDDVEAEDEATAATRAMITATVQMVRQHMPEENLVAVLIEFANAWCDLIAKRQGRSFDRSGSPTARNCVVCGGAFVPQAHRQKTCGQACAKARGRTNDQLMRVTFKAMKELNLVREGDGR
jgi:hypothetical protein